MSELSVGQLRGLTVNDNVITMPAGHKLSAPGHVVQVVSIAKTDVFSTTSTSFVDITGFSISITPTSATSKIFAIVDGNIGSQDGVVATRIRLLRNTTAISIGDASGTRILASSEGLSASGNHMTPVAISFLDSPATSSATTYKLQMATTGGGQTSYLNRGTADPDGYGVRSASSITLMEIAQ
jgi:hypothetical protein